MSGHHGGIPQLAAPDSRIEVQKSCAVHRDNADKGKHTTCSGRMRRGAAATTTTRSAATISTDVLVPQSRHVAHRRAASCINHNRQHDRDSSNHANHKAPTPARTAPANAIAQTSAQNDLIVDLFFSEGPEGLPCQARRALPCGQSNGNVTLRLAPLSLSLAPTQSVEAHRS